MLYYLNKFFKKIQGSAIKKSVVHKTSKIEAGSLVVNTLFDRHSFCGYDCTILNADIKSFCSIANRVTIGGVAHPMEFVSTSPAFLSHKDSIKTKFSHHQYLPVIRTIVGNDVWIGAGVYVKAGVSIGDGAVIGMGSIVTKDVPPYAVFAGNPAKLIKMRFEEEIVNALLKMQWWDLPDSKLIENAKYFNDPKKMLSKVGLL
jgi:acetyltransferase-like isoleucine patch superfamily enzyme